MAVWISTCRRSALQLYNSSPLRVQPTFWNFYAEYTKKSAEEKLGIEKPKRPVTSFLKFLQEIRPAVVAKNPTSSATEIVKIISQHWQQLGDDAKKKLTKEYEKDMTQYKIRLEEYNSSLSEEQKLEIMKVRNEMSAVKEKRKHKAELKELGRPKQPMSSYLLFCQEHRDSFKGANVVDFQKKMKDKWYSLSENEKSMWNEKAKKLKDDFRKQLTLWEEKMIRAGHVDFVRNKVSTPKTKSSKASA